jgi:hypothetical protein
MNSKLLLICLILLLIFTLEWFYGLYIQKQILSSISTKTKASSASFMPHFDLNQQPETSYSDLVNRPLFIQGRRSVEDTNITHTTGVTNNMDWQLSGVYTTRKGLMALLSRTTENTAESKPYRKVIIGTEFDGWAVTGIYNDRIRLTRGNQEKDLPLRKPRKLAAPVKKDSQQPFNSGRAARMRPEPPTEHQSEQATDAATKDNNAQHQ